MVGIEAQGAHRAERAGALAFVLGADRLAGVFDDRDAAGCGGDRADLVHRCALAEQMDGDDRLGGFAEFAEDLAWIEIERLGVDVDEHGRRAEAPDSAGGGEEGEAGQDHFVARADAERHQRQEERVAARGAADRVLDAAILGDGFLELAAGRAVNERAGAADFGHRFDDLFAEARVFARDVEHRYGVIFRCRIRFRRC